MAGDVSSLMSLYERGVLAERNLIGRLIALAADTSPAIPAAELPAEWPAEVRRECERMNPPPKAGALLFITSVCNGPGYEYEPATRELEARWRAGLAAWQSFFGIGSRIG